MTTIHLIRHGQKHSHAGDPGLTEIGVKQAQQTGQYLKQFPVTQIISSPFQRTQETAQQIGEQLGLDYTTAPTLVERMNWNDPAISREEFVAEWIASTHDREYQPKWGDSSRATGERVAQLIAESATETPSHIVLVTHGGAIVDYLRNHFEDAMLRPLHKQYPEGLDFQVFNCSITSLLYSAKPELQRMNFVEHLEDVSE